MNIVSMKQFRENFGPIRKGLKRGKQYLLLYRSKPLAMITPYKKGKFSQGKTKKNQTFSQTENNSPVTPYLQGEVSEEQISDKKLSVNLTDLVKKSPHRAQSSLSGDEIYQKLQQALKEPKQKKEKATGSEARLTLSGTRPIPSRRISPQEFRQKSFAQSKTRTSVSDFKTKKAIKQKPTPWNDLASEYPKRPSTRYQKTESRPLSSSNLKEKFAAERKAQQRNLDKYRLKDLLAARSR
ncbi:MAG: hypothetical protein PVJ09_04345 [Candidatus Woesebacteria bacterium]